MSEEKTVIAKVEAVDRPKRKERQPLTGLKTKLSLTGEEAGFHYAWINEENVGSAHDAAYEFVTHAIKIGNMHVDVSTMQGSKISRNVGGGVIAYLMRQPQEFYDEDMAAEQREKVDRTEEAIFIELNSNGLTGTIERGWDKPNPKLKY